MKKIAAFALACGCIVPPAFAATGDMTYLTCALGENPWQVALNESAGTVSYVHRNGVVFERAAFTGDSVVWETRLGRFTISRIDLSLTLKMGDDVVQEHTCTIVQTPDRVF